MPKGPEDYNDEYITALRERMAKLEAVAQPFAHIWAINLALRLATDKPLRDVIPGAWPRMEVCKEAYDLLRLTEHEPAVRPDMEGIEARATFANGEGSETWRGCLRINQLVLDDVPALLAYVKELETANGR